MFNNVTNFKQTALKSGLGSFELGCEPLRDADHMVRFFSILLQNFCQKLSSALVADSEAEGPWNKNELISSFGTATVQSYDAGRFQNLLIA